MKNSHGRNSTRGAFLNMGAVAIRLGVNFLVVLPILARLLEPADFGYAAMAMTLFSFLASVGDVGLAAAIIREQKVSVNVWASAFVATVGIGLCFALIQVLSAPLLAQFFGEPTVIPLAEALAIGMLAQVVSSIPIAYMQKAGRYHSIAINDIVSVIIAAALALWVGVSTQSVWAIIVQQISIPVIRTGLALAQARMPIRFHLDTAEIRPFLGFSAQISASSLVGFVNRQSDNLLIGRYLGAEALGLYSRAYQVMQLPQQILTKGVSVTAYPAMSRVAQNREWLRLMYLKLFCGINLLAVPMMVLLAVLAESFFTVLLGAEWAAIAPTFVALAVVGIVQSTIAVASDALKVLGETETLLRWSLVRLFTFVPAFALGVILGSTLWLAGLFALANVLLAIPFHAQVGRSLGIDAKVMLRTFLVPCALVVLPACTVLLLKPWMLDTSGSHLVVFVAGSTVFALIWLAQLHWFFVREWELLSGAVASLRR